MMMMKNLINSSRERSNIYSNTDIDCKYIDHDTTFIRL